MAVDASRDRRETIPAQARIPARRCDGRASPRPPRHGVSMDVPGSRTDVERYRRLDEAFRTGDMTGLQRELGSVEGFPNVVAHPAMGACLTYAIYHSPLTFVGALLEADADPNSPDADGFPPLIAAFSCSNATA